MFWLRTTSLVARRRRGLRRVDGQELCRRYILTKRGSGRGRESSWSLCGKCTFIFLCVSSRLTDFRRSPDIETHEDHRGSIGGWGLGNPHEEEATKKHVVEDEDDELDWDQAQSVVERMKVNENGHGERRL